MLNLMLFQSVEMTAGLQEMQRTQKRGNVPFKIRRWVVCLDFYDGEEAPVRCS